MFLHVFSYSLIDSLDCPSLPSHPSQQSTMLIFFFLFFLYADLFLLVTFTSTFFQPFIYLFIIITSSVHPHPHLYLFFHHPFPSLLVILTGQLRHVFPTASYPIISLRTINFKSYFCSLLCGHDAWRYRVWLVRTHVFGWNM